MEWVTRKNIAWPISTCTWTDFKIVLSTKATDTIHVVLRTELEEKPDYRKYKRVIAFPWNNLIVHYFQFWNECWNFSLRKFLCKGSFGLKSFLSHSGFSGPNRFQIIISFITARPHVQETDFPISGSNVSDKLAYFSNSRLKFLNRSLNHAMRPQFFKVGNFKNSVLQAFSLGWYLK